MYEYDISPGELTFSPEFDIFVAGGSTDEDWAW